MSVGRNSPTNPAKGNAPKDLFGIRLQKSGRYLLEGELSFASLDLAMKSAAKFFSAPSSLVFDLEGISKADSAGLALLLEWLRKARQTGVDLHYVNLPAQLKAMAQVVGLEEILVIDQT